ncbi:ketopantoate reductase family protein [Tumebacillus sp. ITR2]|uniref:2-dehydropantoate 2-reductase n=1 Tax=Tumebacillus amylolyticus TaxID=2801339 RepID=A0ABS1JBU2_9BACL|nr:ketopantoate reductase family protein [Tumebacillus amylolyticus]MBL0387742.1 ketopantoate reductase family protein [Tumebacillus amylolyticus]
MRFLVVGAGAVGGYFGGRLVQKGEDVTFLVRPGRRSQLEKTGLVIESLHGDWASDVKTLVAGEKAEPFDVVLLSVKAYHMEQIVEELRPYVSEQTLVMPLLNGYQHFEDLWAAFGQERVLGGVCFISTTLDAEGRIVHTSPRHDVTFGEWSGGRSARVEKVLEHMSGAEFNVVLSENAQRDVWHKYIFIAVMSGITSLFRSSIGPIMADSHGHATCKRLLAEIVEITKAAGAPASEDVEELTYKGILNTPAPMKASMLLDLEKGLSVETDHIHGYLLSLAEKHGRSTAEFPVLQAVHGVLRVYEAGKSTE